MLEVEHDDILLHLLLLLPLHLYLVILAYAAALTLIDRDDPPPVEVTRNLALGTTPANRPRGEFRGIPESAAHVALPQGFGLLDRLGDEFEDVHIVARQESPVQCSEGFLGCGRVKADVAEVPVVELRQGDLDVVGPADAGALEEGLHYCDGADESGSAWGENKRYD